MVVAQSHPDGRAGDMRPTIERTRLDTPHLRAFRARLRELRALSRSAFSDEVGSRTDLVASDPSDDVLLDGG
jgi:hypothetical protein